MLATSLRRINRSVRRIDSFDPIRLAGRACIRSGSFHQQSGAPVRPRAGSAEFRNKVGKTGGQRIARNKVNNAIFRPPVRRFQPKASPCSAPGAPFLRHFRGCRERGVSSAGLLGSGVDWLRAARVVVPAGRWRRLPRQGRHVCGLAGGAGFPSRNHRRDWCSRLREAGANCKRRRKGVDQNNRSSTCPLGDRRRS